MYDANGDGYDDLTCHKSTGIIQISESHIVQHRLGADSVKSNIGGVTMREEVAEGAENTEAVTASNQAAESTEIPGGVTAGNQAAEGTEESGMTQQSQIYSLLACDNK